ncbi:MAG: cupin-like domain-containing protein [Pseudomonadota bacterium]
METLGHKLFERMQEAYQGGDAGGICGFEIDGAASEVFHVVASSDRLAYAHGAHPQPVSTVRMTSAIARFILENPEAIEFRSPTFARQMDVQGDLNLAFSLGLLLRRPSAATVARFDEAARISRSLPPVERVERLHKPSTAEVLDCLAQERPVIVTGALEHWEIPDTLDGFATRFGEDMLSIDPRIVRQRDIANLVGALAGTADGEVYTHGCEIPAAMQRAFPPPFFDRHGPPALGQLWMGRGGSGTRPVTLLHRDDLHGLLAQLYGYKRLLLFSPDQGEYLYPSKAYTNSQPCQVDPTAVDLARHPRYAGARSLEARLGPGEILVNPLGWYHCVFAENEVVSLSYSFRAS